jgi:hypothetical protein
VTKHDEDSRAVRGARARAKTRGYHDEDLIDPIDYRPPFEEFEATAKRAADLIEPIDRNQTPRFLGWDGARHSVRYVCCWDVASALCDIGFALYIEDFYAYGNTKADKTKARQIVKALRRVEVLVRGFQKPNFPLRGFPFAELAKWKQVFAKTAVPSSKKNTRLNALKKRLAVAEAYQLLKDYGPARRRRGRDLPSITATKGGKFCSLAALLYGEPKTDLTNQCKAYIRVPTSSAAEYIEQRRVVWKRFKGNRLGEKLGTK